MANKIRNNQDIFDRYAEVIDRLDTNDIPLPKAKLVIAALSGMQRSIVIELQKTTVLQNKYIDLENQQQEGVGILVKRVG